MSLVVWWRRGSKPGLVIMLLGIAGFVQVPVLWHAQTYVRVLSAELQLIVALGAMAVLGGAYVLMAEAMYRWANIISKRKVRRRQQDRTDFMSRLSTFARSTEDMPVFVGVALLSCLFLMFYFVPFGIAAVSNEPSWLATLSFLDSLFIYPLAVNIAAVLTALVASYMNHKIR
ncbi:MAG: hypothetical protein HXY34_02175 [Candidatus Thorarchaeota archaeon]|nr:hypothetical protein [Candidatus Thorarchaeota archaeon]